MTNELTNRLISRLNEIHEEIESLNNEAKELIQELSNSATSASTVKKRDIKEKLQSLGFKVSSSFKKGSRTLLIEKNGTQYSVLSKHSKFHKDQKYNAWYTLNPDIEQVIDFVILSYFTIDSSNSYLILPKAILIDLISHLDFPRESKKHLFLTATLNNAHLINSSIDLSAYINNFELLNEMN